MRKVRLIKGSTTVEMAYIMPLVFLIFIVIINIVFYYHDKNVLNGIAYETAVVGSQKARMKYESGETDLEGHIYEQVKKKQFCLLVLFQM